MFAHSSPRISVYVMYPASLQETVASYRSSCMNKLLTIDSPDSRFPLAYPWLQDPQTWFQALTMGPGTIQGSSKLCPSIK